VRRFFFSTINQRETIKTSTDRIAKTRDNNRSYRCFWHIACFFLAQGGHNDETKNQSNDRLRKGHSAQDRRKLRKEQAAAESLGALAKAHSKYKEYGDEASCGDWLAVSA
jgi:hypothetical protein